MKRRDVGRHRQGTAFGFARSRGPIRAGGPGAPHRGPGLTRRSSPPPQGGVSRVSRLPVPGATIGAPPGILAAASPVPAHGRVRAQALKGSDRQRSRLEARGQEPKAPRRGAVPDPPIRVRALPSDTVRANHPGRADTDTRPALPSGGSRGSRSLTVPPLCPRARGGFGAPVRGRRGADGGRDRD